MIEAFHLADQQAAMAYLRTFPSETQRRGTARFNEGGVTDLKAITPGSRYSANVADSAWAVQVSLHHDPEQGWEGFCTCPAETGCAHLFAAMSALLAEHRMAVVRDLSSGKSVPEAARAGQKTPTELTGPQSLAEKLRIATGSKLSKQASDYLKIIGELYLKSAQTRQINYWDLERLGYFPQGYNWSPLRLWSVQPKSEHEFWLYLAHYLRDQGFAIPEFMQPVTDFSLIEDRISRWRRQTEIEKWKQALKQYQRPAPQLSTPKEIDLRLILDDASARLQWLRPGKSEFEAVKQNQYRQIQEDYSSGLLKLQPEAELIWQLFSGALDYGMTLGLDDSDPDLVQTLNRLFRAPSLESRIVTANGKQLRRIPEPLRWHLTSAQDTNDDYRLRLVCADGSPAPSIICILQGQPTLYLTDQGLFCGPAPVDSVLDYSEENRIPAPAIEQAEGLGFLQAMGLEMPERVKTRVRTVVYRVTISCALAPIYPDAEIEECSLEVTAEAPDGARQSWDGFRWIEKKKAADQKKSKPDAPITVYDTSALAEIPSLLAPLNLRPGQYQKRLAMRLTKKFADLFAEWLKSVPPHITVNLDGELASLSHDDVAGRVKLEVTEREIDWFDLQVVLDVADTTLTPGEIQLLLSAKGSYVRLEGKGWRRLRYDLSEDENERLAKLGLSPRELSAEPQRLHALQLADEAARKFLPAQQVEQIQRRAGEIKARVAPPLPAIITAQLRPYQLEGFHFLAYLATNRFGGILADDMGLGKTLQTLAWLVWLREHRSNSPEPKAGDSAGAKIPPSLVVCPKSVMDNWHAEAGRFAAGLRVKSWPAGEVMQIASQVDSADVHVINYNQLRLLGENLNSIQWLALVLDEGQYIKNPSSQTAQVARSLSASHRLVLSGTPIENRLMDLWSLMAFTMPGVLGSRAQFSRLYDSKGDPFARRRLAARVRPFLLRRTKSQVAKDLPDRIEEDLFCEIEGEQQALYRAELKAAQQLLLRIKTQKELAQQQFHFLTSLLRLRQICCHPRLVQPESKATSAKCESLLEQLEPLMEEGQKVLVFSQFVQMLDLLRPLLEERHWKVFYLAGQTENRGELVQSFQQSEGASIFLISLKAGGFGLNLTAASYVVLFDPWWNPAVENQAIDRTHRIGQTNKVIAYRLLIKNSIEEKIRELQKQKKALVEDVLGEEKFAQSLTLEDLRFLLSD